MPCRAVRFGSYCGARYFVCLRDFVATAPVPYQTSPRELNENNFAPFDAKLEQRIAVVESRLCARIDVLAAQIDNLKVDIERKLVVRFAEQGEALANRIAASGGGAPDALIGV